jgi:hypothetical protein
MKNIVWKYLQQSNTIAYYTKAKITLQKCFITLDLDEFDNFGGGTFAQEEVGQGGDVVHLIFQDG